MRAVVVRPPAPGLHSLGDLQVLRLNLWSQWCVIVATFGQVGYLADVLQPYLPAWIAVPIFILPVAVVVSIQPDELPDRWVLRLHVGAAAWYVAITLAVEAVALFGVVPDGALMFRVLMHLGWLQFAPLLKRRSPDHRQQLAGDARE